MRVIGRVERAHAVICISMPGRRETRTNNTVIDERCVRAYTRGSMASEGDESTYEDQNCCHYGTHCATPPRRTPRQSLTRPE